MARVRIEFEGPAVFSTEVQVRVSDLNYGNHLGHDALVSILHESRARFLHSLGMAELDVDGLAMMVVDLAVRYLAEAFYGEELQIDIGAGDIGSRSCELLYQVLSSSGDTVALAKTGLVFIDPASRKPAAPPQALLDTLRGRSPQGR